MRVFSDRPFPDLEAGLIEWASTHPSLHSDDAAFRYKHVGDELPSGYRDRLPFAEISVAEGGTDGLTWVPRVEFHVFAKSREEARGLIDDLFAKMTVYPRRFGGVLVDTVEITAWPTRSTAQEPDDDTTCFAGEVNISLRR